MRASKLSLGLGPYLIMVVLCSIYNSDISFFQGLSGTFEPVVQLICDAQSSSAYGKLF